MITPQDKELLRQKYFRRAHTVHGVFILQQVVAAHAGRCVSTAE